MSCRFARWDGAYALGSLEPAERAAYEAHLAGCDDCTRELAQVAELPELLGLLTPAAGQAGAPDPALAVPGLDLAPGPDVDPPVPDTLLPSLVRQARRDTRRRTALLAVAAAVVGAGLTLAGTGLVTDRDAGPSVTAAPAGGVSVTSGSRGGATPAGLPPGARVMTAAAGGPLTADVALVPVAWGTRVDLTCTEAAGEPTETYLLVARTRDGRVHQLGTWVARPGHTTHLAAATAVRAEDIAAVEVHSPSGTLITAMSG